MILWTNLRSKILLIKCIKIIFEIQLQTKSKIQSPPFTTKDGITEKLQHNPQMVEK